MRAKSKSFSIVIYPPSGISKKAIGVSKKLKSKGGLFVLDGKNYFPHITSYMTEFPLRNVTMIRKLLRQLATKTKSFQINSLGYRQDKNGYVDTVYRRSNNVSGLQGKIIKLLNPLREGLIRDKDRVRMGELGKAEQKNIKLYGYRSVGVKYFPHLTFTKLEKFNKSDFSRIDKLDFSFKVSRIGFFYSGEHGTCRELIEIFDLS